MLKWTLQKSKRNHHLESITTTKQLNKRRRHNSTGKVLTKPATNTIIESSLKSEYTKNKLKISIPISLDRSNTTTATAKMTTATIERHFRRSSFGGNDINLHRRSLTTIAADSNKENLGIFFARSPTGNTSLNALQDLSNGKSPNRLTTPMPMRRRTIAAAQVNIKRVSEEFESTAAPTVTEFDDTETLNQIQFRSFHREESLSSSRIGDTTLDKMLDAIIESARLEVKCQNVEVKQRESSPPPRSLLSDCEFEDSIHEMEVCTPTHLKRQRVVRRKNNQRSMRNENRDNNRKQEMIGLTLPNGIPSPETPKNKATTTMSTAATIATSYNYLAAVETPQNFIFIIDSSLPKNFPKDVQRCSTPTVEQAQSIKRCLSFSPNSDEEELKDAKRSSVALSIVSSEGVSSPGRSSRSLTMPVKGSLDLAIFIDDTRLNVHVIRCRDLQRANGSTSLNAYVKVTLIRFKPPVDANGIENSFQRTAVHRHSSRPYFDHRFVFDLQRKDSGIRMKPLEFKAGERVQLAVWHRDRQNKRSEFLGCMSFPLCNVAQRSINGSYKLQSQSCLNNPIPAIPAIATTTTTTTTTISAVPRNHLNEMATLRQQKSEEDVISIDSMTAASMNLIDAQTNQPVALSKKALHQRDADENLFLRFLELDPPGDATGRQPNKPVVGRTPFTVTKRLTRTVDRGFGFSIVWTHPPRVEKVEPGLSADRNGIQPGDYVIFVDKHNVVTMPESDVLNLIRSQGNNLTMEIFRRSHTGSVATSIGRSSTVMNGGGGGVGIIGKTAGTSYQKNSRLTSVSSNYTASEMSPAPKFQPMPSNLRPGISSIEAAKKRLHLPQVTFSKESIAPITDNRRRFLLQLISREQNFISALLFGMQRFVQPLSTRKDLISPNDHRTLFQNIDELLRLSEDILEQLCHDSQEPQMNFTSRVYLSKTNAICAAYKKYCNGIKRADCVLVNKSRQAGSEFVSFITEPQVPRKCPDLTMFIHRPLQHFREILKLMQLLASNCHVDSEEHRNFTSVINELQAAYREITVTSGLMEPLGEGRPLLTLQDLESRMVFTKCKPFTLAVQGRQWIFGGDLSRVEGRSVKPYWTLLFSDIIVFAKVSRDRVLFITEEPVPIANIVDSCFHMRKKTTEFRLTVDPNGRLAESPTGYCAPDLTRTPKKSARRKSLILRAPSLELKAVWQNLLQRQIFLVNAALGSTPLSSPLDSPDVLNTLVPLSDIGMASASIGSVKHSSLDCINLKNQQQSRHYTNPTQQIEKLIDEKCRILNKTGTPRSSALHLANWMKGQLDKQQEQARLAAARSRDNISREDEHLLYPEGPDSEERITYWTRSQLEKRTKELNLAANKEKSETIKSRMNFNEKRSIGGGIIETNSNDCHSAAARSHSRSTTSGSQITVRSSPVAHKSDKFAVCRKCHRNCQQQQQQQQQQLRSSSASPPLLCNSLQVQHSQSSPHRCCRLNGISKDHRSGDSSVGGNGDGAGDGGVNSISSISSSTVTGEHRSSEKSSSVCDHENNHKQIQSISSHHHHHHHHNNQQIHQHRCDNNKTLRTINPPAPKTATTTKTTTITDSENEMLLITDDSLSQSDTSHRDDSSSSIRILDLIITATIGKGPLVNGHCSEIDMDSDENNKSDMFNRRKQLEHPSRRSIPAAAIEDFTSEITKVNSSPKNNSLYSEDIDQRKFIQCNCICSPEDFQNNSLSPDEMHQETCRMFETTTPQKSPSLSRVKTVSKKEDITPSPRKLSRQHELDLHQNCKCVCGGRATNEDTTVNGQMNPSPAAEISPKQTQQNEDEDISTLLIGLAQLTPTVKCFNMDPTDASTKTASPCASTKPAIVAPDLLLSDSFVPTIAVVPPTPDATLSKTSTNIWDSTTNIVTTTSTTTQLLMTNMPRQAVIENIPDDSADDSAGEEEPPYRPMSTTLRRYGTLSSLEKLPSEDRLEVDSFTDDGQKLLTTGCSNGGDDLDGGDEYARADALGENDEDDDDVDEDDDDILGDDDDIEVVTKEIFDQDNMPHSSSAIGGFNGVSGGVTSNQWTSRAGSYVAGKMSFFEESRAFIDKYLGRWNQENAGHQQMEDDQIDDCTSGATSGEEIWGTPTSGGDNDDIHMATSENTHSSPTKSSTSLNDDDDTELMMDELLMAPPMTASTIRGLLPRRRLEPLFEEETESDEEKTQQLSEDLKKGEMTTNGHDLEDSTGTSSDEEENEEEEGEQENSLEGPIQELLPPTHLLPSPAMPAGNDMLLPLPPTMKESCCEYLLEQKSIVATKTTTMTASHPSDPSVLDTEMSTKIATPISSQITMEMTATSATMTMATTMKNNARSLISTTINNVNVTTNNNSTTNLSTTIVRKAKFIPPPPPPRRVLLTPQQEDSTTTATTDAEPIQPMLGRVRKSGVFSADTGYSADVAVFHKGFSVPTSNSSSPKVAFNTRISAGNIVPVASRPSATIIETSLLGPAVAKQQTKVDKGLQDSTSSTTVLTMQTKKENQESAGSSTQGSPAAQHGSGLSPRLEMRLALNHDILGDEDLISYDPGPDLTTILGHDLSTFHRLTGRDLLNRSATNRVQPKEAVISFCQQRNSKMDTPTVNRRPRPNQQQQQHQGGLVLGGRQTEAAPTTTTTITGDRDAGMVTDRARLQPNRNTWSGSAFADRNEEIVANDAKCKNNSYSSDESKLSDLEILARREMIYCMSQSRSGSQVKTMPTSTAKGKVPKMGVNLLTRTRSTSSMGMEIETGGGTTSPNSMTGSSGSKRNRKIGRDETALMESGKGNRLINFLRRRNSEIPLSQNCSNTSLVESNASSTLDRRQIQQLSPRKDNDKPSLNRRLWKQITKRRRANSVSEIAAS